MKLLRIRAMTRADLDMAIEWAAAEGWNPGLHDADTFLAADPGGFLLGLLESEPVATISAVRYGAHFGFIGFYIVRPESRGQGHGIALWRHAMERLAGRTIGLDGVVAQQDNYQKSGFRLAYPNVRYGGRVATGAAPPGIIALADVPFALLEADDATVFPAPRTAFLRTWIDTSGHVGRALVRDGRLVAWGVIRPSRTGCKIGPLVADDRAAAEAVFAALAAAAGGGEIFLDVPSVNRDAVALAGDHGLSPVFETARMYTGPIRPLRLERVFGVTTFELG